MIHPVLVSSLHVEIKTVTETITWAGLRSDANMLTQCHSALHTPDRTSRIPPGCSELRPPGQTHAARVSPAQLSEQPQAAAAAVNSTRGCSNLPTGPRSPRTQTVSVSASGLCDR